MGKSNDFKFWDEKVPNDSEVVVTPHSPILWKKTTNLLPHKHHYTSMSPTSRIRGRNEFTEMINNIPESSYELSLKDIVDDHQKIEEVQENEVAEKEKKVKHKRENKKPQKSKNCKSSQICSRTESEVFLLKMFLPASLASKPSQISPSEKHDWWKMISAAVTRNTNRSTSDTNPTRTSGEKTLIPCQKSFSNKKSISRGQKGCLF